MLNCNPVDGKVSSKANGDFAADCSSLNLADRSDDMVFARKQLSKRHENALDFRGNEIHILRTNQTPEYIFNDRGVIKIQGRGLYCDKPELSARIFSWIEDYLNNPARVTHVTIALEYLNSLSASVLISILRKLSRIMLQPKKLEVKWYYEVDDENILDRGKYISSACDIPIEFILTKNVSCI
jgi:hypothetical protein